MAFPETAQEKTDTLRTPCEAGGRDWSDTARSQGTPGAGSQGAGVREAGRGEEGEFLRAFRWSTALLTPRFWTFGLQNC